MTTALQQTPTARPSEDVVRDPLEDVVGSIEDELFEQAVGEQLASLGTMPSISTVHCLTSKHDTVLLPRL
ncbi:hypothetical protein [Nocardioides sp. ChNu-99]|uniref:hypothetical protein n=1 Tax=Nocardioides sp. ChNu-99 TaxID=2839897 RepID=UPI0024060691|nr:hypothetical protein [Nocardioides sp. ChNu-99]MDF9717190.1 hypothetical protein [Nocardioides sp. ChNu-99]